MRRRLPVSVLLALFLAAPILAGRQDARSTLIDAPALLRDLKALSADDMQGRQIGTPGGAKARAFVVDRFKESGLKPFGDSFEQPFTYMAGRGTAQTERQGVNVVGRIEGAKSPSRYIVISAHYDHIGTRNGAVFNGADDNASGTAALFALAKYFGAHRPANTLIFAAFDGEESGLRGARAFVAKPPVDPASIVIDLNMDMIGRDPNNLLFVVGTYTQPGLKPFIERIAAKAPVTLVMGHDDPAKARENAGKQQFEDWTADSDHKAFCDAKIPCLYFGVEDFDQHHKATDDYETITYAFYVHAAETMVLAVEEFDARAEEVVKAGRPKAPRP
jgi:Zn-dependent M28 family amino/carboxypeptidase